MPFECPGCREMKPWFELHRIVSWIKGFGGKTYKHVYYRCAKCMGWK